MSGIVYVVDDDASFRTALRRQLETIGYRVVTFASAEQFLEQRSNENEPGCILLDVRMPGLSGPALQSRLAEAGSMLPILFLTGYTDVSTTVQAIKAGADDFLIKPVTSDRLHSAIERALERHRTSLGAKRRRYSARPLRDPHRARTAGICTCCSGQAQQADSSRIGNRRTNHQSASQQSHGEDGSPDPARTCVLCRTAGHFRAIGLMRANQALSTARTSFPPEIARRDPGEFSKDPVQLRRVADPRRERHLAKRELGI